MTTTFTGDLSDLPVILFKVRKQKNNVIFELYVLL